MNSIDSISGQVAAQRGPFIGRPMPRFEDLRLVRGAGNYTDDVTVPRQSFAVFVRSPHAHARIVSIDSSAAHGRRGVLAVLTGDDYVADGHIGMAHFPNPADANDVKIPTFTPTPERKRRSRTERRRYGRTRPTTSRSTTHSAIAPRSRPRSRALTWWSSRPSAASAPPAPSWSRARRSAAMMRPQANTL
jgi:hypothetical protein